MDNPIWTTVDDYFNATFVHPDAVLDQVLRRSVAAGLPQINVTASQGKFLQILAAAIGARRVLEIGTLGGYSTTWIARGLPGGARLVTIEAEPRHAAVARETFRAAGIEDIVDLRLGAALDVLPQLASGGGPFDLTFIDADKPNTPAYFDWAIRLSRPGAIIVIDNVVRDGEVSDVATQDERVVAMRRVAEQMGSDARLTGTGLQTVGSKGYDGFFIARVNA
jgi:predicted O-methyltransferase YrrM